MEAGLGTETKKAIVLGCSRVGVEIAVGLEAKGYRVTILDKIPSNLRNLPPSFKGTALQVVEITESTLSKANIEGAEIFLAITDEDNYNLLAAQIAKILFDVPKVICFLNDRERKQLYEIMGIEVINPTALIADEIAKRLST